MTSATEEAGVQIRASGALEKWFEGCDEKLKKVAETVNGVLLSELLREGGHKEPACANIFREGGSNAKHGTRAAIRINKRCRNV